MERANEIAYDYIQKGIMSGKFLPAQRLVESQLSEEIGVSRNTIRKALQKLESEKLVCIEANKGATVASLDFDQIQQYYEIRSVLEAIVIKSAAKHITDKQLADMEKILADMDALRKEKKYDDYSKNNLRFHSIIYKASGKSVAVSMILEIKKQLRRFQIKTMMVPGRSDESWREHNALLAALKQRDADMASAVIVTHIDNVLKTILDYKNLFY